jgi:hypothetical protein
VLGSFAGGQDICAAFWKCLLDLSDGGGDAWVDFVFCKLAIPWLCEWWVDD